MKRYQLFTFFWIAVLLSYFIKIHCTFTRLKINHKKVHKVRRQSKDKQIPQTLFSSRIEYLRDNETECLEGYPSLQDRRRWFARGFDNWKQYRTDDTDSIFPTYPKFHPECGVMFNNLGRLVPGVKKTFLFVSVDIQEPDNLKNTEFHFLDC